MHVTAVVNGAGSGRATDGRPSTTGTVVELRIFDRALNLAEVGALDVLSL
jgi:gamma-glutamyl:cysteine ligase YbdK (ATP-grasp superfamily)